MDFAKILFETMDKMFYKSFNESVEIDGAENISIFSDKKYSKSKKFDASMDLYFDEKIKAKRPVLLYIHGGGFVAGGKEFRKAIALWYATKGFFVVNVNYGLCPECVFPEQIRHLVSALNWIKKNEKKYNLDLKKIVVSGDSAGAYFSSMIACVCESKALQRRLKVETDVHISAVVLNCGLYDLDSILTKKRAFGLNDKIFESYTGSKREDLEKYEYKELCSPLKLINKSFPPVFLIYAKKDIFCSGQAELLAEKLKKKDIYYEKFYSTSPFINHCFSLEWKNKPAELVMTLQESFLEKVKKGELPKKLSDTMTTIKEGKAKK